jgi:uncharacterized protein (DUF1800 family)
MNRRTFLETVPKSNARDVEVLPGIQQQEKVSKYANKVLPSVARTTAGLEPYTGPWGFDQVAHLLRRTMFGPTKSDIQSMLSLGMSQAVTQLLADSAAPNPPVTTNSTDVDVPIGQTWVNSPRLNSNGNNPNGVRVVSLKAWWIGLMIGQPVSARERMTLFWHNNLVTEADVVADARFSYRYVALLRQYALGNYRTLMKQITIDGAMLRYLNGNTNTAAHPNENYARELQELFTIGKGPEIAPGNYTNYTEADVQAAARVLTGWREDGTNITTYFTASRHDSTNKQFSPDYDSTVITGQTGTAGANEVDSLLDMIFAQGETAEALCRKLYRWFVYYLIDNTVEANVIAPMADLLRSNNYEVRPVLQALLSSAHFYDPVNIGCVIKDPLEVAAGMCRQFSVVFPDSSNVVAQYAQWNYIRTQAANMQLDACDPPNVAGWPALYQIPQFYELWINSDTLPKRNQLTDTMAGSGHSGSGTTIVIDPIAFANQVSDPSDPNKIVGEFSQVLFPIAITDTQKTFLKDTLIPGLPDYEWTNEWNSYKADPTNAMKLAAVKTKLQALIKFMMDMAEYQLM